MGVYHHTLKETMRPKDATPTWPSTWPNLSSILKSLDKNITCLQVSQVADGIKH